MAGAAGGEAESYRGAAVRVVFSLTLGEKLLYFLHILVAILLIAYWFSHFQFYPGFLT